MMNQMKKHGYLMIEKKLFVDEINFLNVYIFVLNFMYNKRVKVSKELKQIYKLVFKIHNIIM